MFLAGVLAACGGVFLPGDRGLSALSAGVPWSVQSALYGTDFYCYCCLSGGFAGAVELKRDVVSCNHGGGI